MMKTTNVPNTEASPSAFLSGIEKLIALTEEQLRTMPSAPQQRGQRIGEAIAMDSEEWELFLSRLQQIKEVLHQDQRLLPVVDDFIGKQVHKMERRQWWSNITLTIFGAILGWLISAIIPLHILGH